MSSLVGKALKHFQIEKLLGKGGMGVVYLGRDVRLNRPVAIKVIRPDLTENRDRQRRFLQEARSAADLKRLKAEIESGTQRSMPIGSAFLRMVDWIKFSMPFGIKGISGTVVVLILALLIIFTKVNYWTLGAFALCVLFVYRYIRNRKNRMLKKFTAKVSKFPEVLAISQKDDQIIVIVDQAEANLYLKVNSLVEAVNQKLYFGAPIKAAVRDDLSTEDFQSILRESGILYVREDIVLKK